MPTRERFCQPRVWENNFKTINGRAVGEPIPDADGWQCCMCRKDNLNTVVCRCGHGRCHENTNPTRFDRPDPI
jgi:hypothetical protein